jgi:DNA-binding MarR family transcriptional regulator
MSVELALYKCKCIYLSRYMQLHEDQSCVMTTNPTETTIHAWTRLMRAQHAALSHIEGNLKQAGLPALAWYDVLLELSRAGEGGLRPFELERRMLLPQYGLSRLIDRIEAAGYLERRPCEADGRGQVLAITEAGEAMRRQMWPVYSAAIEEAVGARLTAAEAASLAELLQRLTQPDEV